MGKAPTVESAGPITRSVLSRLLLRSLATPGCASSPWQEKRPTAEGGRRQAQEGHRRQPLAGARAQGLKRHGRQRGRVRARAVRGLLRKQRGKQAANPTPERRGRRRPGGAFQVPMREAGGRRAKKPPRTGGEAFVVSLAHVIGSLQGWLGRVSALHRHAARASTEQGLQCTSDSALTGGRNDGKRGEQCSHRRSTPRHARGLCRLTDSAVDLRSSLPRAAAKSRPVTPRADPATLVRRARSAARRSVCPAIARLVHPGLQDAAHVVRAGRGCGAGRAFGGTRTGTRHAAAGRQLAAAGEQGGLESRADGRHSASAALTHPRARVPLLRFGDVRRATQTSLLR